MLKVIVTATLLVYYVNAVVTEKKETFDDTDKSASENVNRREAPVDGGLPPDSYNPPPDSTAFIGPKPVYGPPQPPPSPSSNYGPPPPPLPSDNYGPPLHQPPLSNNYGPPPSGPSDSHSPPPTFPQASGGYGPPQSLPIPSDNFGPPPPPHPLPLDNYGPPPPPPPPTRLKPVYGVPLRKPKPIYGPPFSHPKPVSDSYGPPPPPLPPPPPPRPVHKPKPIYGPPKPVYGPPNINYGPPLPPPSKPKPIYGPPKQPKPLYGPPLKPPFIHPPKQFYGPPPRPVYGPPVKPSFISPPIPSPNPSYGPPPDSILGSHGDSSIQGNTNIHLSSSYGPPPIIPHGPSIPAINSFEESPRPPPGVPAPPTPPDITYDGWQPMPGLTSHPHDHSTSVPTEGHNINFPSPDYGGPLPPPSSIQQAPSIESSQSSISSLDISGHGEISSFGASGQDGSSHGNSLSHGCCALPEHNSGESVQSSFGQISNPPSSSYGTPESGLLGSHISSPDVSLGSIISHSNAINSPSSVDVSAVSNSYELLPPQGSYRQLQDSYGPPPSGPSPSLSYGGPPPPPPPSHSPQKPRGTYGPPSNPSDTYGLPPPVNNISPPLPSDSYGGPPPPPPLFLQSSVNENNKHISSNAIFGGSPHQSALSQVLESHVPSTSYGIPPLGSYIPPITNSGGGTGPFAEPGVGAHIGSNLPGDSYGVPLDTPVGIFGVPISGCCGTPPPNISPPKETLHQIYLPPSISTVNNPGLSYGIPSGKQVEGPNIQPKVPVKFREPVPKGLLESIAQSAQYKSTGHGLPFQGQTYIPPSVPDFSKPVKENNENNLDNHVDYEHGVSGDNSAFQITPSLSYDLSPPSGNGGFGTDPSLYGVPNTPAGIISLPSEAEGTVIKSADLSNNYSPTQTSNVNTETEENEHFSNDGRNIVENSDLNSQHSETGVVPAISYQNSNIISVQNNAAHSQETEINSLIESLGLQGQAITSSQTLDLNSLAHHNVPSSNVNGGNAISYGHHYNSREIQNIPIQGALGSYTLQIQPANGISGNEGSDNSISHDEVLSNGLLQDILAAIEQQPNNNGHHQTHFNAGDPLHTSATYTIPQYTASKNDISHGTGKVEEIAGSSSESVIQLEQKSNVEGHSTQLPLPNKDNESFSSVLSKSGIALYFNSEHGRSKNATSAEDTSVERQIKLLEESSADKASYVLFKSPDVKYVYGEMSSSSSVPTSHSKSTVS